MTPMLVLLLVLFFGAVALLFVQVFYLVWFWDLEQDRMNSIEFCSSYNKFVWPEMIAHWVLCVLLLFGMRWLLLLFNLPLAAFHVWRIRRNQHKMDATRVFYDVKRERRLTYTKMGFYMICFFSYLYSLIFYLVKHYLPVHMPRSMAI